LFGHQSAFGAFDRNEGQSPAALQRTQMATPQLGAHSCVPKPHATTLHYSRIHIQPG
jgi:hypothetical protein